MYHLPAYVALRRWSQGRRTLVLAPRDLEGVAVLRRSTAELYVVNPPDPARAQALGLRVVDAISAARAIDLAVCIEGYDALTECARLELLDGVSSVLSPGGAFVACHGPASAVDFWTFERELRQRFSAVALLAQLPWTGVSLAPVLEDGAPAPTLAIDEGLLEERPTARRYLAVACRGRPPAGLHHLLTGRCLMVPLRTDEGVTAVAPAQGRGVDELERALERTDRGAQRALQSLRDAHAELTRRAEAARAERDHLHMQLEVSISEREGARKLASRVEGELELARRKIAQQEERHEQRQEELTRLVAEVEVLRARLEDARGRRVDGGWGVGPSESGRTLSEVAFDRNRLREELARRAAQIQSLDEELWSAKARVQQEGIEHVRLQAEFDRMREQAERALHVEAQRSREVARLSQELHEVEVDRDRLAHEVERYKQQTSVAPGARGELERGLEACKARLLEAEALAKRRSAQLSQSGAEFEALRRSTDEYAATAASLQAELEVKALELQQQVAIVSDLQRAVDAARQETSASKVHEAELQQKLERSQADREALQSRLRQREQELEDLLCAHETSSIEVYKLRRELEATAQANEQLEEALGLHRGRARDATAPVDQKSWPEAARLEVRRLREQLAAQAQDFAARLASDRPPDDLATVNDERSRRLQLEAEIRAQEHEHALGLLDAAEQRIWEMTDASDRNAARFAASLAQLEKHKEQLDETQDELDVTKTMLATAEARNLELERMLASERARLARVGGVAAGATVPPSGLSQEVDAAFSDLEFGSNGESAGTAAGVVVESLAHSEWPAEWSDGRGTHAGPPPSPNA